MSIAEMPKHAHVWVCALDRNVCAFCGATEGLNGEPEPFDELDFGLGSPRALV